MTTSVEVPDNNWRIVNNESGSPPRSIINLIHPIVLTDEVYNYTIYTPIVLAPINKSSTLVLGAYDEHGKLGLKLHDLRMVDGEITSSVGFMLRGSPFQLSKFKNEMNRVADKDRCVGIGFLLRKLFYGGFSCFYAPKILHPKTNSTLRAAINAVNTTMNKSDDNVDSSK